MRVLCAVDYIERHIGIEQVDSRTRYIRGVRPLGSPGRAIEIVTPAILLKICFPSRISILVIVVMLRADLHPSGESTSD